MPRYEVRVLETRLLIFEVEAADAAEAEAVALAAEDPTRDEYQERVVDICRPAEEA